MHQLLILPRFHRVAHSLGVVVACDIVRLPASLALRVFNRGTINYVSFHDVSSSRLYHSVARRCSPRVLTLKHLINCLGFSALQRVIKLQHLNNCQHGRVRKQLLRCCRTKVAPSYACTTHETRTHYAWRRTSIYTCPCGCYCTLYCTSAGRLIRQRYFRLKPPVTIMFMATKSVSNLCQAAEEALRVCGMNLEVLSLAGCRSLTSSRTISSIKRTCKRLVSLDLSGAFAGPDCRADASALAPTYNVSGVP